MANDSSISPIPHGSVWRNAVIGLGANLGPAQVTFRAAARRLQELGTFGGASRIYSGPAVGPPQPDYLNAALCLAECRLGPRNLMRALLDIEREFGRVRGPRWGPRTLDLDLLFIENTRCQYPDAQVPHPRLAERAFALRPLLEVVPRACDPTTGIAYRSLLDALGPDALRVVAGREWAG